MRQDTTKGTFEDVFAQHTPEIVAIAYKLRELISAVYPDVLEIPKPGEQHIAYAIGLNKASAIFGYICPLKEYVRLGFYYGGGLPDPTQLLVGTGKRLRHIKIYALAEAEQPAIRQLIEAAIAERQAKIRIAPSCW